MYVFGDRRFLDPFRFIAHIAMAYVFTFWTCYSLYKEYEIITNKRLQFLAAENRRPDQFTVSFYTILANYIVFRVSIPLLS